MSLFFEVRRYVYENNAKITGLNGEVIEFDIKLTGDDMQSVREMFAKYEELAKTGVIDEKQALEDDNKMYDLILGDKKSVVLEALHDKENTFNFITKIMVHIISTNVKNTENNAKAGLNQNKPNGAQHYANKGKHGNTRK